MLEIIGAVNMDLTTVDPNMLQCTVAHSESESMCFIYKNKNMVYNMPNNKCFKIFGL